MITYTCNDAYQLMRYGISRFSDRGSPLDSVGPGELPQTMVVIIWNSRDGVSPFCCQIGAVEYEHVDWGMDRRVVDYVPPVGSHIFVDWTIDDQREHAEWMVKHHWGTGEEYDIAKAFATKGEFIEGMLKEFRPGQPKIVQVDEVLYQHFKNRAQHRSSLGGLPPNPCAG